MPITQEFGWSRAEFQLALLFSTAGVVTAPLVGIFLDKVGIRKMALIGLFGLGAALSLASQLNGELWMLYLVYALMAILGAGTIPVTWTRAVTNVFSKQRGLALGIMLSGTGICAIVTSNNGFVTENFGWRLAYRLAACQLVAGPLVLLFFWPTESSDYSEQSSDEEKAGLTFKQAIKGYRFWVLLISIFVVYIAMSGIVPNLIPALIDQGIGAQLAATAISVFGVTVILGRLIVGYLVDVAWAPGVAAFAIGLPVIGA